MLNLLKNTKTNQINCQKGNNKPSDADTFSGLYITYNPPSIPGFISNLKVRFSVFAWTGIRVGDGLNQNVFSRFTALRLFDGVRVHNYLAIFFRNFLTSGMNQIGA